MAMNSLIQTFLNLLVSPPGNLIYHLVLVFAVTGTVQTILVGRNPLRNAQVRSTLVGLGILLMAQVVLFLASGLAWQGLLQPSSYLPILDRSMIAFSILWITWLWAFPAPQRLADALTLLVSVGIVIMLVFSLVAWNNQTTITAFNASWIDWLWGGFSIIISLVGLFLLLIRRPPGFGIGMAMLTLNIIGHLAHFMWTAPEGDYSAIIRLTQLCAYPLLPSLIKRLHSTTSLHDLEPPIAPTPSSTSQIRSLQSQLQMLVGTDPHPCQAITQIVAQALPADICLFARLPEQENDPITIECGNNIVENLQITKIELDPIGFPALDKALSTGRMTWIEDEPNNILDVRMLGSLLGLSKTGDLLLIPLKHNGNPWAALLLLSPFSNHYWSPEDLQILNKQSGLMVQILHHTNQDQAPIELPAPAHDSTPRQLQREDSDTETTVSEPLANDKDEIIKRLQEENIEMNAKFVQLQQDIILLGEQLELPFSNLAVLPDKGPNQAKMPEQTPELTVPPQQDSGQAVMPEQAPEPTVLPQHLSEQATMPDQAVPSGSEYGSENDTLIVEEDVDPASVNQILTRIHQDSVALAIQANTPLSDADELASELAVLMSSQQDRRTPTPTTEQLLAEINSQSEQLRMSAVRWQTQNPVSEDELSELETIIAIDNANGYQPSGGALS
jgi:hypothetical protein